MKKSFIAKKGDLIEQIKLQLANYNYNQIKTLFRKKDVKINGLRVKQTVFLNGGELVELFLPQEKQKEIPVIFEDENIIIANKSQGMETTKKDKVYQDSKCLEDYFENCFAVHRLDKNTEGLVILAKSEEIFEEFKKIFKTGQIKKYYKAIVYGVPKEKKKVLQDYATKKNGKTIILPQKENQSVLIKTGYEVEKNIDNLSLLNIELFTGYTHQIRSHLSKYGYFVLGDDKYGKKQINRDFKIKKQLLCAYKIMFNIENTSRLSYLNQKIFVVEPTFSLEKLNKTEN